MNELRDVKFRIGPRILGHTDFHTVHVDEKAALHAAEVQNGTAAAPVAADREGAPVDAGRVLLRHKWRLLRPRHLDVGVVRVIIPLHGPVARHGDIVPARIVEAFGGERLLDQFGAGEIAELPLTVEVHDLRAVERLPRAGFRLGLRRVREERGTGTHPVDPRAHRVFPEPGLLAIEQFHDIFLSVVIGDLGIT